MRRCLSVLGLSLLLAATCGAAEVQTAANGLTYSIRVPNNWEAGEQPLMVVGFHGWGGNHANFIRSMESFAFLNNAIVIAPDAPKAAAWEEADIQPVDELIADLQKRYKPGRTVAFGFSRGAYFAFGFGLTKPERVQAVVPHSGGLLKPVPADEAAHRQVFYVIHGDADNVVPVDQSRSAVKTLQDARVSVEYDEIAGLAHTVDAAACARAFTWLETHMGAAVPKVSDEDAAAHIEAIEDLVDAEDYAGAASRWSELEGVSSAMTSKVAKLARAHLKLDDDGLAVAAIEVCGSLAADGLAVLKKIKGRDETRAIAAAEALGRCGERKAASALGKLLDADSEAVAVAAAAGLQELAGDEALKVLIDGLDDFEDKPEHAERCEAISEALAALSGESWETAKEWKAWARQR